MDDVRDFALLQRWRDGDATAGNALFGRHFQSVSRFFRTKVDEAVEDLVQATFLACVEARDRFEGRSSFRGYLFGIARKQLLMWYARRRDVATVADTSIIDLGASPTGAIAARQEEQILLRALRRLALDHQVALELFYWERLKGEELADVLGVSPHTVRSRLSRARASLRDAIDHVAADPELARSTASDLEGWAESLRAKVL